MKHHINVLYGIVVVLLILQIISFVFMGTQLSKINSQQGVIQDDVERYVSNLEGEIGEIRQENQFGISALTQEVAQQKTDIESQINLLKSSQEDFSGVIEDVIKGVVSITTDKSTGSGFIIKEDGYIVTNSHVIEGSNFVTIGTFDNALHQATVVGVDVLTDLALLKIDGVFEELELADSDNVQIGENVIAIGNPLGLSFSVTEGIVSGKERVGPNGLPSYIQIDAALNPGNSGGPLIDKNGEVIGINNFKIGVGTEGLGFAFESNGVKDYINLIANMTVIE